MVDTQIFVCHLGRMVDELKEWRNAKKLSLANAALLVGVGRQTWHRWEKGTRVPTPSLMSRLIEITGLSADVFYQKRA